LFAGIYGGAIHFEENCKGVGWRTKGWVADTSIKGKEWEGGVDTIGQGNAGGIKKEKKPSTKKGGGR